MAWQELIRGATNVANDANPSQIRLDEKLKDPSAAAVNYLNGTDLKFLEENITTGDRMMSVVMDPTSWPVAIMGGKAIITNAVNNTKEQLIAVGVGAGLGAGIQYGTTGEVKLSDVMAPVLLVPLLLVKVITRQWPGMRQAVITRLKSAVMIHLWQRC